MKQVWKPSNMLAPVPAVLVTVRDPEGNDNVLTIAWAGTVCSDPAMVSISVRKERFSYPMIAESGEFVINLVNRELLTAADYCGVRSGRQEDKFAALGLEKAPASAVRAPLLAASPVNLECRVTKILPLGSHDMFLAEIVAVDVDEKLVDGNGRLMLEEAGLISYIHGGYFEQGPCRGTFGFSVRKRK
ncbi:MAG: flavin reductase family protein [Lachnospiraceae bacterium]|nr:flavin reductase family protein [Lachnospiraceae bacterium]